MGYIACPWQKQREVHSVFTIILIKALHFIHLHKYSLGILQELFALFCGNNTLCTSFKNRYANFSFHFLYGF